jgi:hypothetical protein
MAAPHPIRYRGRDASSWALTSLALSAVLHLLLMHFLGGLRMLDVQPFTERISRWFNVVEVPESVAPEIEEMAKSLPEQAENPPPPKPEDIPLAAPRERPTRPAMGTEPGVAAPKRRPERTRLPSAELPVIHRKGTPNVDQTLTQMGELAPVPGGRGEEPAAATSDQPGQIRVASALPQLPEGPDSALPGLEAPEARAERPATDTHAAPLEAPAIKPTPTAVHLPADTPPAGLVIPLEGALAREEEGGIPRVLVGPNGGTEGEDPRPVIPFGDEVDVNFEMYAEPGNPRAYFRFEIRVAEPDKLPVIPKDVVFICDVSLSIRAQELEVTRQAVGRYLEELRPVDRFNIVAFSEQARKLFPGFVEPTAERVEAAQRFIHRIPGQIKTDVYRVLRAVVRDVAQHSPGNRPCNIYFVSDGASTQGIRDVRRIVNDIGGLAQPNFAIFPFDAGRGGNRYLLDLLAYRSRGTFAYTDVVAEAPDILGELFTSHNEPVLMNLRPAYGDLNADEIYPAFVPHLYTDEPIVIYGRCSPGQDVTIKLQGDNPFAHRSLEYQTVPGAPDPQRADIAREWARRKIHHLVSLMAKVGEKSELKREIRRLGERYQIRTLYRHRR